MQRVLVVAVAMVLLGSGCGSGKPKAISNGGGDVQAARDPVKGHALLDSYFEVMRGVSFSGSMGDVLPLLDARLAAGVELHDAGAISDGVFGRHQRLVEMSRKLFEAVDAGEGDKRKALTAEIRAYAAGIEGGPGEIGEGAVLVDVAPALVAELVNLHMEIDGVTDHAGQRAAYEKKYVEREEPGTKAYDFPADD